MFCYVLSQSTIESNPILSALELGIGRLFQPQLLVIHTTVTEILRIVSTVRTMQFTKILLFNFAMTETNDKKIHSYKYNSNVRTYVRMYVFLVNID